MLMCNFFSHNLECKINSFFWNLTVCPALCTSSTVLIAVEPIDEEKTNREEHLTAAQNSVSQQAS